MKTRLTLAVPLAIAAGCATPHKPTSTPAPTVERVDSIGDAFKARFKGDDQIDARVGSATDHFRNILDEVRK